MENHPIPQDVTGFKFRLIGSITLKQFLYLLGAGAIALVFYFLPFPWLVKIPFMLLSGAIGMAFAFVPINGRPMDKMLMNFAKAIPAENQFLYHKKGADMIFFSFVPPARAASAATMSSQTQNAESKALLFSQQLSKTYFKPDKEEQEDIQNITSLFQEGVAKTQGFTTRVIQADSAPATPVSPAPIVNPAAPEEIRQVSEQMVKPHLPEPMKNEDQSAATPAPQPQTAQQQPQAPPQQAQPAQQPMSAQTQGPVSAYGNTLLTAQPASLDTANVVKGTVVDPRGKPLPHIIVEVLDANEIPVRAFRTNQTGSFASATPLPNGTYKIHLEDSLKKQNFSDVELILTGAVIQPLTIVSVDQREQLRRELFGGINT